MPKLPLNLRPMEFGWVRNYCWQVRTAAQSLRVGDRSRAHSSALHLSRIHRCSDQRSCTVFYDWLILLQIADGVVMSNCDCFVFCGL